MIVSATYVPSRPLRWCVRCGRGAVQQYLGGWVHLWSGSEWCDPMYRWHPEATTIEVGS